MRHWLSALLTGMIRCYQWLLSPLLGPSCRFSPSCSHYGLEAIRRHGPFAGLWLILTRVGRCHPWGGSGHDPVPARFTIFPWAARRRTGHGHESHQ